MASGLTTSADSLKAISRLSVHMIIVNLCQRQNNFINVISSTVLLRPMGACYSQGIEFHPVNWQGQQVERPSWRIENSCILCAQHAKPLKWA